MDKTTKGFADELALKHVGGIVHDEVDRLCKISYRDGYLRAIEETNVKQLQEENERLREALGKIATGTHPYNEFEAFSFVDTAKSIARNALSK